MKLLCCRYKASNNVEFGDHISSDKLILGCNAHASQYMFTTVGEMPETISLVKRGKAVKRALVWRREDLDAASEILSAHINEVR